MFRTFACVAAVGAAFAMCGQAAEAQPRHADQRLTAVSVGVGAASSAAVFAINDWHWKWHNSSGLTRLGAWGVATIGCAAISPMVATVVLDRPLTQREAGVLIASCVLPIVGGWLVNAAYDAHPEWDPAWKPHARLHRKR